MVSSSRNAPTANVTRKLKGRTYFDERRARVDGFVKRNFAWSETFRLHSAALGLDILRAPVNVILSPLLISIRIMAYFCRSLGLRGLTGWLAGRRILLRTSVARRVETLILTDLLEVPIDEVTVGRDPDALARAVLSAPQLRDIIRKRANAAEAEALGRRIANALSEYAGTRSAVADMTTGFCTLMVGGWRLAR